MEQREERLNKWRQAYRSQQERLADETDEQRASRLEQLRRSQQERFADETTCQEALPGIPVPQSRECKRCSNDEYHRKIYYNITSYHVCCLD